jgi:hypothetical protein
MRAKGDHEKEGFFAKIMTSGVDMGAPELLEETGPGVIRRPVASVARWPVIPKVPMFV